MTGSHSNYFRFASQLGVDYRADKTRPYGGFKVTLPVAVIKDDSDLRLQAQQTIALNDTGLAHLKMFAMGAYQPLTGFMNRAEVESVVHQRCLPDYLPWEMPVYLTSAVPPSAGDRVNLVIHDTVIAQLQVDRPTETDRHRVAGLPADEFIVGGKLTLLIRPGKDKPAEIADWNRLLDQQQAMGPRPAIAAMVGAEIWRSDDEYQIKNAVEMCDRVLLHPVARPAGAGNDRLPSRVVEQAGEMVLQNFYGDGQVRPSPVPEVIGLHEGLLLQLGIIYQNLGCRFLMIMSPQKLLPPEEWSALEIELLLLEPGFHCLECGGHATIRICTHDTKARSRLSEGEILNKLVVGEQLPLAVARPEVARLMSRQLSMRSEARTSLVRERHIFPHASGLSGNSREQINGHRSAVLWMTGLSGSGKSTLAARVEKELVLTRHQACMLDGDTLRNGLCGDLDFSAEARKENLRRAAETAKILADTGMLVIASFISPFSNEREMLRKTIGDRYMEIYVEATLEDCEKRDPKGLYKRARAGLIPEFTGISSPYEPPANPDLRINTSMLSIDEAVRQLLFALSSAGYLNSTELNFDEKTAVEFTSRNIEQVRRN